MIIYIDYLRICFWEIYIEWLGVKGYDIFNLFLNSLEINKLYVFINYINLYINILEREVVKINVVKC